MYKRSKKNYGNLFTIKREFQKKNKNKINNKKVMFFLELNKTVGCLSFIDLIAMLLNIISYRNLLNWPKRKKRKTLFEKYVLLLHKSVK